MSFDSAQLTQYLRRVAPTVRRTAHAHRRNHTPLSLIPSILPPSLSFAASGDSIMSFNPAQLIHHLRRAFTVSGFSSSPSAPWSSDLTAARTLMFLPDPLRALFLFRLQSLHEAWHALRSIAVCSPECAPDVAVLGLLCSMWLAQSSHTHELERLCACAGQCLVRYTWL